MSFIYLQLKADGDGKLHAVVTNDGALKSLGSPNSRLTGTPIGVFQIESFEGLERINFSDLFAEVLRRCSTKELLRNVQIRMTDKELLDMLRERLKEV